MKLLLENWKKYITERKLADSSTPLFLPFRTDIKIYNNKTSEEYGLSSPENLNMLFARENIYGEGPEGWLSNDRGNELLYRVMVDSDAPPGIDREALKNSTALWLSLWGYVGLNRAPTSDQEINFIRQGFNSGNSELKYYTGAAYRGIAVSENWIYQQLFGQEGYEPSRPLTTGDHHDKRSNIDMGMKDYINLYRLMRGEKVITPQTKSGYWKHKPRERAESWARKAQTAHNYGEQNLASFMGGLHGSDVPDGEVLYVVMVADAGDDYNTGKFLDLDPLYKNTIFNSEEGIGEVPVFLRRAESVKVEKAIIPYKHIKKIFKSIKEPGHAWHDKLSKSIQTGKFSPINLESKQNQKLLKEQKYSELYEIEQDWEIIF
jgi:hypothetical protein